MKYYIENQGGYTIEQDPQLPDGVPIPRAAEIIGKRHVSEPGFMAFTIVIVTQDKQGKDVLHRYEITPVVTVAIRRVE